MITANVDEVAQHAARGAFGPADDARCFTACELAASEYFLRQDG